MKAKDLVRMAVAKAGILTPLTRQPYAVLRAALVIGGGISGMVCALSLANQGIKVHLVEKENQLGGMARRLRHTVEGDDVQGYLKRLIERVYHHLLVQVHMETEIKDFSGYVGNFRTALETGAPEKHRRNLTRCDRGGHRRRGIQARGISLRRG